MVFPEKALLDSLNQRHSSPPLCLFSFPCMRDRNVPILASLGIDVCGYVVENGFMGMGIGAAMTGLRPIIEGMNMGFLLLAYNQISNNAGMLHYTSGGQFKVHTRYRPRQSHAMATLTGPHRIDPIGPHILGSAQTRCKLYRGGGSPFANLARQQNECTAEGIDHGRGRGDMHLHRVEQRS
jgi:hypothetical protein